MCLKSFSLSLKYPFFVDVKNFSCEMSLFCYLKCPYSCFPSHFFLFTLVNWCLYGLYCFWSFSLVFRRAFLSCLPVVRSMDRGYYEYWQVLFLSHFLPYIDCQRLLLEVRPLCIITSFLVPLAICLSFSRNQWSRVYYEGENPFVIFYKIPTILFGSDEHSRSPEIPFYNFCSFPLL